MDTKGIFILHEGSPHLILNDFPAALLHPAPIEEPNPSKDAKKAVASEVAVAAEPMPRFVPPAQLGHWPVETQAGVSIRDGYLYSLVGRLGENGRRLAKELIASVRESSHPDAVIHQIKLGDDGGLISWSRLMKSS